MSLRWCHDFWSMRMHTYRKRKTPQWHCRTENHPAHTEYICETTHPKATKCFEVVPLSQGSKILTVTEDLIVEILSWVPAMPWFPCFIILILLLDMNSWNSGSHDHDLGFGDTDSNTCWRTTVTVTCPDFQLWGGRDGKLVSGTLNQLPVRWETDAVNQLVIFSYDLNKET